MNESGDSVGPARGSLKVPLDRLVVLHDEIDLPFGEIAASPRGRARRPQRPAKRRRRASAAPTSGACAIGVGRPDSTDPEIVSALRARPLRRARRRGRRARRRGRRRGRAAGRVAGRAGAGVSEAGDHVRRRRGRRRAAAARPPRGPQRDEHARCSRSCSGTSRAPATTTRCACWSSPRPTTWALSAGADVREQLDEAGAVRRMELFARVYDELTAFPSRRSPPATATRSAAGPRSPCAATCGSAARTCGCASPARRSASRSARRGSSPCAASRPPSTCCSPRATSPPTRRCGSGSSTGSLPRPATEDAALELAAEVAAHPPEARRPPQADAAPLGRRRGALARRGPRPGRVAALRARASRTTDARSASARMHGRRVTGVRHDRRSRIANERLRRARRGRAARPPTRAAGPVEAHVSSGIRRYLLAALLEAEDGLAERPALLVTADDRSARDLARELAPTWRRAAFATTLARHRLRVARRAAAAPRRPADRGAGLAGRGSDEDPPVVVASAVALAEAVPDAGAAARRARAAPRREHRPRRRRGAARRGRLRARRPGRGARPVRGPRRHPRRLPGDRGARRAGRAVRRRDRVAALVLDLHPALARRRRAGRARARGRARRRAPRAGRDRARGRPRRRTRRPTPAATSASCCRSSASAPLDLVPARPRS